MKKFSSYFLVLVTALLAFTPMSNAQETETRSLGNFKGISVATSIEATLQKGSSNSIDISAKGVDLDKVHTDIEDGVLMVRIKNNKSNWSWGKKNKVQVTITYANDPDYLSVSSSGDITGTDVIRSSSLRLKASSSGDMKIEVDVDELEASVSSSADLMISGTADKAKISASSSADFLGKNLEVGDAHLSASSSADIEVRVNKSIEASASSSGDIVYWGNPTEKGVKKSSSGDVTRRNG